MKLHKRTIAGIVVTAVLCLVIGLPELMKKDKTNNTDNTMTSKNAVPGTGGDTYIPLDKRSGDSATVYFTRKLSPEGLIAAYEKVCGEITAKEAVKDLKPFVQQQ